jgi:hypothetical protein
MQPNSGKPKGTESHGQIPNGNWDIGPRDYPGNSRPTILSLLENLVSIGYGILRNVENIGTLNNILVYPKHNKPGGLISGSMHSPDKVISAEHLRL